MESIPAVPRPEGRRTLDLLNGVDESSVSRLARGLIGSEVLRIAAEVRALVAAGKPVCNLTVGDFDAREFAPPPRLLRGIGRALAAGHTNYPPSNGVLELRQAVTRFYGREFGLDYPVESVLVAGGARPLIYATYRALVDPGEAVAYPVPSWNNNHYCYLSGACGLPIEVSRASRFHPTPAQVRSLLPRIRLLALNTPLNPTGTAIEPEALREICRDLVAENAGRHARGERPVFLMFDQVYWSLDFRRMEPVTPPGLLPEVAPYTVMLDAISKSLAATGLRVGWSVASPAVTQRMSDLLGHVGAWAPKAEQMATAEFLDEADSFGAFRLEMHRRLGERLERLARGLEALGARGLPVEVVPPEGTLYLSARFGLFGRAVGGSEIRTNEDIRRLLLHEAGVAMVPFQAFGLEREDGWFRLSVGAVSIQAIEDGVARLGSLCERVVA
ncbi:MAG: aminotransferase class I/II-fold pyridoxal phosphate-dependent enzyme [Candidatus Eisenbacteria bacterium]|uniref:Aminotransferase class I/II-fold pyridoxal phosphate-dependent enzyme n=1 Tax=Eiseniibacteriota bacterium TaxID=2212470 RepID=A0A538SNN4_UNCEI|nr:MAG: aminotransferase class I/II-fold pyridoxal phosphate-dependent enzyme [Candidatus Eisenbacteria bacterium]